MSYSKETHRITTFQISKDLHAVLKTMCILTNTSMGEFIRGAIVDKINNLKVKGRK